MSTRIRVSAIEGRQGGHLCWATMLTVRAYLQMTDVPDPEMSPEQRAQRDLSEARAGKLADYLLSNPDERVLSAVTLLARDCAYSDGVLELPLDPDAVAIADGQHRRRALEIAVASEPALREEHIPATIFPAGGVERARRVFVAINSGSPVAAVLRDFYDPREGAPVLEFARHAPFDGLIEFTKPNPSPRSGRIWSLSAMLRIARLRGAGVLADTGWWADVLTSLPGFNQVRAGNLSAREARETYIWAHGVGLEGIGQLHGRIEPSAMAALPAGFWLRTDPRWVSVCTDGTRMLTGTRSVSGIAEAVLGAL